MLRVYSEKVNQYFGCRLLKGPWGTLHYRGKTTIDTLSLVLNVDNLMLLNKKGQPNFLERILRKIDTDREEKIKEEIKNASADFYKDMETFDWKSKNIRYPSYGLEVYLQETTTITQVTTKKS